MCVCVPRRGEGYGERDRGDRERQTEIFSRFFFRKRKGANSGRLKSERRSTPCHDSIPMESLALARSERGLNQPRIARDMRCTSSRRRTHVIILLESRARQEFFQRLSPRHDGFTKPPGGSAQLHQTKLSKGATEFTRLAGRSDRATPRELGSRPSRGMIPIKRGVTPKNHHHQLPTLNKFSTHLVSSSR